MPSQIFLVLGPEFVHYASSFECFHDSFVVILPKYQIDVFEENNSYEFPHQTPHFLADRKICERIKERWGYFFKDFEGEIDRNKICKVRIFLLTELTMNFFHRVKIYPSSKWTPVSWYYQNRYGCSILVLSLSKISKIFSKI